MKRLRLLLVIALFEMAIAACSAPTNSESQAFTPLNVTILQKGFYTVSGKPEKKTRQTINNQADYSLVMAGYTATDLKLIPFETNQVLFFSIGGRSTGGYDIKIISAIEGNNSIVIKLNLIEPGSTCMVTQAFTHPYIALQVPSLKKINVIETNTINPC